MRQPRKDKAEPHPDSDIIGRRIAYGGRAYRITSIKPGEELGHGTDYCAGRAVRGSGGVWLPVSDARARLKETA